MRAARKRAGKTQSDVARLLQTSQANVSKLENAMLIPSAPEWFEFCEALKIPVDSLRTGLLDMKTPVALRSDPQEAGFRLPKRYAENRASTIRASMPILAYASQTLGEDKVLELIESLGVDGDLLVELSNQLNINFTYDILRALIEKGQLDASKVEAVGNHMVAPTNHGLLAMDYQLAHKPADVLASMVRHSNLYTGNFAYRLEDQKEAANQALLEISIAPEAHLRNFNYRNDPQVGDLMCHYHKTLLKKIPSFNAEVNSTLEEVECHFHGAERCLYRVKIQAA